MEWKPIETAPKDDTRILIYDGTDVVVVRWEETSDHDKDRGWPDGWYDAGTFLYAATHWMPLPEPPTKEVLDD